MKRKIILICVLLVISLLIIGKYKYLKNDEPIHNIKESNIAIMVYDDESDSYVKQNSIPKGAKYSLNEELTKCEAGGQVTNYNKANGTLKYVLPQMDYCYVYFDVDNTPSYAIYSETDNSLIFYKNNDTVGEEYNDRIVTAKYDDIEDSIYTYDSNTATPSTPWYEYANAIKTVSVANEIMPISTAMWFTKLINLESINLTNLNTSSVTTMERMFDKAGQNNSNFTLNLGSKFDTSNVVNMSYLFNATGHQATNFILNLGSKFDTSRVTNMKWMFNQIGASSTIFELDLEDKFDTSNVTDMQMMFNCLGFNNPTFTLDLGDKFDTSNVTDMLAMFNQCGLNSTLMTLNLGSKFDTSKVTNMQAMFRMVGYSNPNFELKLGTKFNSSCVTDMYQMFYKTGYINPGFSLDLSNFVIRSSCNLADFVVNSARTIIVGEGWSNATLVSGMFKCDSSTSIEIVNAPANILSYDFAADNRVATFTTI